MGGVIDALGSAASGIRAGVTQVNAVAHNLANLQTTKPMEEPAFAGERPLFGESASGGTQLTQVAPAASEEGIPVPSMDGSLVRAPGIDVGAEMVQLIVGTQQVAANVHTVGRAVDTYRDLLAMTTRDRSRMAAAPVDL
jgi:flagellar basal-body rod protein FlgC